MLFVMSTSQNYYYYFLQQLQIEVCILSFKEIFPNIQFVLVTKLKQESVNKSSVLEHLHIISYWGPQGF